MQEIKRCPFCGSPGMTYIRGTFSGDVEFFVCCTKCSTKKSVTLRSSQNRKYFLDVLQAMDDVIGLWNQRADE